MECKVGVQSARIILLVLTALTFSSSWADQSENRDYLWQSALQQHYFQDREIVASDNIISLDVPKRAENAALVPVRVRARIQQSEQRYIKTLTLLIDQNPNPMVGVFHLSPKLGLADMSMRVRVNSYTQMRAIAELSDGSLHMSTRFVKASGGCSAPAATNMELAMSRLGKIRMQTRSVHGEQELLQLKLNISHPNITGLQTDQVSRSIIPAHYVKELLLSYRDEVVLRAETDIAISENPSFRFHVLPEEGGELAVRVIDSRDEQFSQSIQVPGQDSNL